MKRYKRIVVLAVICVLLLSALPFNMMFANATTVTSLDTGYPRPQPASDYYIRLYMPSGNSFTWSWSKSISVGNLHYYKVPRNSTSECEWAYCIDPDKLVATDYTPTSASAYWNYLSLTQRTGMALALRFGYQENVCDIPGFTPTTIADKIAQYVATQMVVWEYKEGVRSSITAGRETVKNSGGTVMVPSDTYYNCVRGKAPEKYYNRIVNELQKYYTGPSFCRKTSAEAAAVPISLNYDKKSKTWSAVVTDSNNTGITAEDIKESLGSDFTVSRATGSNSYTISTNTPLRGTKTVYLPNYRTDVTTGRSNESLLVWANGTKQTLITGSNESVVNVYMSVKTQPVGTLAIKKTLAEAEEGIDLTEFDFQIKNDTSGEVQNVKCDKNGNFSIDLVTGNYTVTENLEANSNNKYWVQPEPQKITVSEGVTTTVTFENLRQKGIIKVSKVGNGFVSTVEQGEAIKPVFSETGLEGAVFDVIAAEDIVVSRDKVAFAKGDVVETITTDKEGTAQTSKLYMGKYLIKEVKAPSGFVKGQETLVEVTPKDKFIEITGFDVGLFNTNKKVKVNIHKKMAVDDRFGIGNGDEYKDVKFGLFAAQDFTAKDGSIIEKDRLISEANVDEEGYGVFDEALPIGKYYIREIATNDNYVIDTKKYHFDFGLDDDNEEYTIVEINDGKPITNPIKYMNLVLTKTDKETGELVNNAIYGIWKAGEKNLTEETALATEKTKEGKLSFENLVRGSYVVRELKAPEGYLLDEEIIQVSIGEKSRARASEQVISTNDGRPKGKITIEKLGEDKAALEGAEFDVVVAKDIKLPGSDKLLLSKGTVVCHAVTDKKGIAETGLLELGEYNIVETKAPKGYVLDEKPHQVVLNYENQETDLVEETISITNAPVPIVKTGDINSMSLYLNLFLVTAGTVGLALIYRKILGSGF